LTMACGPAGMKNSDFCRRDQWAVDRRIARPYAPLTTGGVRVDNYLREPVPRQRGQRGLLDRRRPGRFGHGADGRQTARPPAHLARDLPEVPGDAVAAEARQARPVPVRLQGPSATLVNNHWCLGHNGGSTNRVSTDLEWFPDNGYVYIGLINYEGGSSTPIDLEARRLIVQ
jgi:hypothetical protein